MKHTVVKRRRTGYAGERLVMVICPICGARHWLPDDTTGHCLRRLRRADVFKIRGADAHRDHRGRRPRGELGEETMQ
ncbi:MAG: hypothetical protein ACRDU0_14110 [Mycobacterium sp.]